MVDSRKFLSSFPYLYNFLGITDIKQVKEKLKFEGKINTQYTTQWEIIGISYNPYSLTELKLQVNNGNQKHKIVYREETKVYKGEKLPTVRSREPSLVQVFDVKVQKPSPVKNQDSSNVEFFPIKKAS